MSLEGKNELSVRNDLKNIETEFDYKSNKCLFVKIDNFNIFLLLNDLTDTLKINSLIKNQQAFIK